MTKLSPVQRDTIKRMYRSNGISYGDRHDRTLLALRTRGLTEFQKAHKYGRDCWHLTDEGQARAAQCAASDTRRKITASSAAIVPANHRTTED